MIAKLPNDVNGNPIQALTPIEGVNKADTQTWVNTSKSTIVRVCPIDADAVIIISKNGITIGDGTFMAQWLPEYLHIPLGRSVYCSGAIVNFTPCH